jgi:hypothetical protein
MIDQKGNRGFSYFGSWHLNAESRPVRRGRIMSIEIGGWTRGLLYDARMEWMRTEMDALRCHGVDREL